MSRTRHGSTTRGPRGSLQVLRQRDSSSNNRRVRPTAKTVILDLLATLREGSMPVRALVAAGALFDLDENNVRVALTRLLAAGLVERDERGRYRAGERAGAVGRRIARWRRIEE